MSSNCKQEENGCVDVSALALTAISSSAMSGQSLSSASLLSENWFEDFTVSSAKGRKYVF